MESRHHLQTNVTSVAKSDWVAAVTSVCFASLCALCGARMLIPDVTFPRGRDCYGAEGATRTVRESNSKTNSILAVVEPCLLASERQARREPI